MKLKLTRPDGSIVEAEGTPEECAALLGTISVTLTAPKEIPSLEEIRKLLAEALQRLPVQGPTWVTPYLYPYGPWWYGAPYVAPYPYQFPWSLGTTIVSDQIPCVERVTIGDVPGSFGGLTSGASFRTDLQGTGRTDLLDGVSVGTFLWNPNEQAFNTSGALSVGTLSVGSSFGG